MTKSIFLTKLADEYGNLRHYTRVTSIDGDTLVFDECFIKRFDMWLSGVSCDYSLSEIKDFNGFLNFADGSNSLEEYKSLDKKLGVICEWTKFYWNCKKY